MDDRQELTPWIAGIYVVPGMRGRGIGTALIERIVDEAVSLDVRVLYLHTTSAVELYAKLGWKPVECREYLGAWVTVMARQLAA